MLSIVKDVAICACPAGESLVIVVMLDQIMQLSQRGRYQHPFFFWQVEKNRWSVALCTVYRILFGYNHSGNIHKHSKPVPNVKRTPD